MTPEQARKYAEVARTIGCVLVPGVFEPDFIGATEKILGTHGGSAIANCKYLPPVLSLAHELCGAVLQFTEEDNVNFEPQRFPYNEWHFDAPWPKMDERHQVMPLWRFAVYFRDYTSASGGLEYIPHSHIGQPEKLPPAEFRGVMVPSQPGDLVIWNLRTIHRGGADNVGRPHANPRNALFFDYASPGPDLDCYVT